MTVLASAQSHSVGFLLIDGFALMSYASAIEPLRAANLLSRRELYRIRHFAVRGSEARSSSGAIIPCDGEAGSAETPDILLVCAGGEPGTFQDPRSLGWIRRLGRAGIVLGGISGGPLILARAGVMEGRRLTVHWEHAAELAEQYPELPLSRALYVIDRNRITCGGGTAPMDLMHALIAEHHGPDFARTVSDWFLHTQVRAATGAQKPGIPERYGVHHRALVAALGLMENHIADPLDQAEIAAHAGISDRQLRRLFRGHFAAGPMEVYRRIRLEHAQELLRQTALSVTEIALACGFAGVTHFTTSFRRQFGITPAAARRHSGGPGE